jgi:hypothetical protein
MGEFLGTMARLEVRLAQDFYPLERSLHTTFGLASALQKLRTLDVQLMGWKPGAYVFSDGVSDWERKIREYHSTPWKLGDLTSITMTGVSDDMEKKVFEDLRSRIARQSFWEHLDMWLRRSLESADWKMRSSE